MKNLFKLFILIVLFFTACKPDEDRNPIVLPTQDLNDASITLQWSQMALTIAATSAGNSPTFASRGFGYIGLTMYETVVNSSTTNQSVISQLTNAPTLTKPQAGQDYNWFLALNAGQALIIKSIYGQMQTFYKNKVDSLEKEILTKYSKDFPQDVIDRSVNYGKTIALEIFEWSKTDGGHEGYLRNIDPNYKFPTGPGYWVVPTFNQSSLNFPLHPYWGNNRRFIPANAQLPIPTPMAYSSVKNSAYYNMFLDVYNKNKILTDAEKETALWWSDDPSQTFTPPGHSYSLGRIAVATAKPNLVKAAETFARVGMAVGDAFMNCWKCKYTYHSERPSTYVRANIDSTWRQFWPEPPFPAYISGHATQGAACATVLTDLYGENFAFTDNSHDGRAPDPLTGVLFKNRSYPSFWAAAEESAYSRFLGGIHTKQDNDTGLIEGKKVAQSVNALKWKKG